jgi:hypothetical protein
MLSGSLVLARIKRYMSIVGMTDSSNSVLKNATCWDSKSTLVQQEKFFPQG